VSRFAIHQLGKPQILRVVSCHLDQLQWQLESGQVGVAVEPDVSDDTHYVNAGQVVAMAARPTPDHSWDWETLSWIEPALELLRANRWDEIKAARTAADLQPYPVADFEIDADAQSRQNIMGAIMAMQLTGESTRLWRCADNTMRELSLAQLITAGTGIAARLQQLIEISDQLWQQLQAATTAAGIEAVIWTT
jgi:hypothetical protein